MRKLLVLIFAVLLVCLLRSVHASKTLIVPDQYPYIQNAIDAASSGDTVLVKAGTYYENLRIQHPLTLQGENAVIDGSSKEYVVWVRFNDLASNVTIKGFTIQNGGTTEALGGGIRLSYAEGCKVQNCTFTVNTSGVVLEQGSDNEIVENVFLDNTLGIYLYSSNLNVLSGNSLNTNVNGIGLYNSGNNLIVENVIQNCSQTGIYLSSFYSQDAQVSFNSISGCDSAVYVENKASHALISDNNIFKNYEGVRTSDSGGFLQILDNNFTGNTNAAINFGYLDAGNNTLSGNTFKNNAADVIAEYNMLILPLLMLATVFLLKKARTSFSSRRRPEPYSLRIFAYKGISTQD